MATTDRRGATVSAADPPIGTNPNPDLAWKAPVRAATVGSNINLQTIGLATLDGVVLAAGDRVLVKDQTDAKTNGLYNASTGPWTRTIDAANNSQFTQGLSVIVTQGTVNANAIYELTSANPITIGTTALTYASLGLPAVPATRNINTSAPLAGGGALSSDLSLSLTIGGTLAVVGNALQTVAGTGDVTWSANSFSTTIAAGAVTNAKLANAAANTIKGNVTGSSAAPTDFTIDGLTVKGSPAGADEIIIWDVAGTAIKKATISSLPSSGGATFVAESGMRLTLVTATPVMTSTQSAKTTIFLTPYKSQFVPIYDGTNMTMTDVGGELSQATTDTTKSPAAVAASSVYDLFVWNDSGTFRCTRGPLWTNDTTRSAGTALTLVKGVWLNNATITNGPAASRGTYVGTVRSNGSSQIDYIFGAQSTNGTAAFFGVWNMYNRVQVPTVVSSSVATWTYNLATIRSANNSATMRVTAVFGLSEDTVAATYGVNVSDPGQTGNLGAAGASSGLGLDSTTTYIVGSAVGTKVQVGDGTNTIATGSQLVGSWSGYPGLGVHFIQALENSQSSDTTTFTGGTTVGQNALVVNLRM